MITVHNVDLLLPCSWSLLYRTVINVRKRSFLLPIPHTSCCTLTVLKRLGARLCAGEWGLMLVMCLLVVGGRRWDTLHMPS